MANVHVFLRFFETSFSSYPFTLILMSKCLQNNGKSNLDCYRRSEVNVCICRRFV